MKILGQTEIYTRDDKIKAIRDWPRPQDKYEMGRFLGICNYYRRCFEGFVNIAAPLRVQNKRQYLCGIKYMRKSSEVWTAVLCSSPILAYHRSHGKFYLGYRYQQSWSGSHVIPKRRRKSNRLLQQSSYQTRKKLLRRKKGITRNSEIHRSLL